MKLSIASCFSWRDEIEKFSMALAKIFVFLAKANLTFICLPPAKAGGN
jgi:hypothetical protein